MEYLKNIQNGEQLLQKIKQWCYSLNVNWEEDELHGQGVGCTEENSNSRCQSTQSEKY